MQAGKVDWLTDTLRRVLAPNPSAMTGPGTNSYILGRGRGVVLVDPGPDDDAHVAALLAALDPTESVGSIIVTHAHRDHSQAAPRLSALTGAPVMAFGDAQSGRSALMQQLAEAGLHSGGEGVDHAFRPDITLADGQIIACPDGAIRVLHTPGHMGGHICLGFGDILLSGDHAMGWSTSLVSPPDGDMGAYMASLARLMVDPWRLMCPGHGPVVPDVAGRLTDLQGHRRQRERQILDHLALGPATAEALTSRIYTEIPANLQPAARRNVLAHLIDLWEKNLIRCTEPLRETTIFTLQTDPH